MEQAMKKKFISKMEDLKAYLAHLLKMNFPVRHIREGLQFALEPIGIDVPVDNDPLLIGRRVGGTRRRSRGRRV